MELTEPTTLATDYLLFGALAFWAIRVMAGGGQRMRGRVAWASSFGVTALAALLGGSWHGFRLNFAPLLADRLWLATEILIGIAAALTLTAGLYSALRPDGRGAARRVGLRQLKMGLGLSVVGLAVLLIPLSLHRHFNHNDLFHLTQLAAFWFWRRSVDGNHPLQSR